MRRTVPRIEKLSIVSWLIYRSKSNTKQNVNLGPLVWIHLIFPTTTTQLKTTLWWYSGHEYIIILILSGSYIVIYSYTLYIFEDILILLVLMLFSSTNCGIILSSYNIILKMTEKRRRMTKSCKLSICMSKYMYGISSFMNST